MGERTITPELLLKGDLHGQTVRRTRFDRQVFEVMFELVDGVFGCRTRLSKVFDNQIPRSHVRTSLQTLVCRTAFDEPFDRGVIAPYPKVLAKVHTHTHTQSIVLRTGMISITKYKMEPIRRREDTSFGLFSSCCHRQNRGRKTS
ncbi:hypothetical protein SK128_004626 [Halocaridina rubra]|uniref:Uncharacterized protein n=1 Tax=Halocaridina rubra TaxID=373956 RepID=A0AAN9A8Z2_HALRR